MLVLGLASGCGGNSKPPDPPSPPGKELPDASRSTVEASRTSGVAANGSDSVTLTVTIRGTEGTALAGLNVQLEVSGEGNLLTPASGKTNAEGIFTASLASSVPGSKRITASVEADGGAIALGSHPTIEFSPLEPARLVFPAAGIQATAGEPLAPAIEVAIQDEKGVTVRGATLAVTLELASGPVSSELQGTLTVNAVDGVARFTGVIIKKAGTGYSLRARAGSLVAATSSTFEVVPAPAAALELTGLPASMAAGGTTEARVALKDAFDNPATNYTGTLHFTSTDPSAVLPADFTFSATDAGQKTFTGLSLRRAGAQRITVADTARPVLSASADVRVGAAAPARLAFTQQPGNTPVRAPLGPVKVSITDDFGNLAEVSSPDVTLALTPASVTLSGTRTVTPTGGVASFTTLTISQEGTGYTLTASAPGLAGATSAAFNVVDDAAPARPVLAQGATTTTSITVQWTAVGDDGTQGTATSQELRYSTSNIVTDADFSAAALVTAAAPLPAGSSESAALTGLAPGSNYYVALKVTDNAGNSVRSATLPISTSNLAVAQLAFITQPVNGTAGTPLANVRVALQDSSGATVSTAASAVTLNLRSGPVFTPVTVNAEAGVATFTGLRIDTAGAGYRFEASSGALSPVQSASFAIAPAAAASLELGGLAATATAGASISMQVTARDGFGNVATGYTGTVHFTSTDPAAVLPANYTFTAGDAGLASFSAQLRTAGSQSVTVTDTLNGLLTSSASTTVGPGAPSKLVFSMHPGNGTVRASLSEARVVLADGYGNPTTASSPTVTVGLTGGNPAASLTGTLNVSPVSGVASFTGLSVDQEGTGFQLTAAAAGLMGATSSSFTIVDDIAPAVAVLTARTMSSTSVRVTWTAVGDDGNLGNASSYELRYATSPITTEAEFAAASRFTIPPPRSPGMSEEALVTGLSLSVAHHFALKVLDGAGNFSRSASVAVAGDPCEGVVCTPPASSCSPDGNSRVTYTSACTVSGGSPVCQDTPAATRCATYEVCSAGNCAAAAAADQAGRVLISEFSALGVEFIELHNPGATAIDVHGYTLRNLVGSEADVRAPADPNGTAGMPVTVPAGGFLYGVANPAASIPAGVGFVYGAPGTAFSLADTGDVLALYAAAPTGNLQDVVDFRSFITSPDTALPPAAFVGFAGSSTQLHDGSLSAAANDAAAQWCVSFYPAGSRAARVTHTAGAPNGNCNVAVVNEAFIDALLSDDTKTFVELAGPGGSFIGGAKITDVEGRDGTTAPAPLNTDGEVNAGDADGEFALPAGTRIPVDGILLIADTNAGGTTAVPGYVPGVDVPARDMDMEHGGGDSIQLISAAGVLLDVLGHDGNGANLDNATAYNGLATYEGGPALSSPAPSASAAPSMARSTQSGDTGSNRNDFHVDPTPTPGQANDAVNFTVTSLSPDNGPATTGAVSITVTGTDFAPGMRAQFGTTASAACPLASANSASCNAPANTGNAVERVSVTFSNPASVGATAVLLSNGFTYTGSENETDSALEADICRLQSPASFSVPSNQPTVQIFGRLDEAGVTEAAGAPAGVLAEVGYGFVGQDPRANAGWRFFPASYNAQQGTSDEFAGTFTAPSVGTSTDFLFAFRFSFDGGLRWTYCDLNGAGSNVGLTFEPATQLGVMTVTP